MLEDLKAEICDANRRLPSTGLVKLTWGNISGIDRDKGIFGIKPSGVDYGALTPGDIVLVDLDGQVVEGQLNPSSDTKTHLALYRAWEKVGGICHTHSAYATMFSQAGNEVPCFGTTHADHFYGPVPVVRILTTEEVDLDYEALTGTAIIDHFKEHGIDPSAVPGALQHHHAPFTWGKNALKSLENSIALEMCAQMALETLRINPDAAPLPQHLLDKHFLRKHGPGAYYGQKKA